LQLIHHQVAEHVTKVILCPYIICKSGSDFCHHPRMNWPKEELLVWLIKDGILMATAIMQ
jgi:hypothetical protein